ncbi:Metallo-beta-lactamase superfamily protein [Solibacillus isronensis B3W22]|uniref:Metallo-beta-lactamase superfamily protein n=1 Tax=Solibacillus isronensis B3W22 TaxID=1224748 RepID=K1L6L2_9BACL|nr:MBL fold metallo-hydrolase [Solibacillus isronensis]AMO84186.1 Zn-dependent hydrolase [Solibacillus silvestris]EKB46188.1 Metallo-beta-lactamase superfamily protein [Solibacillus isronensis B3W22]
MHSIHKIGKSFWYITPVSLTDRPILGMVVGSKKTLMIDAGNSEEHMHYFLNELQKRGVPNPDLVVLTHWHWDHIFGLSALPDTVSIASKETEREMEKLIPFSWSDEAIDARVNEGVEIEFCAKAIKEEYTNHRNIKITFPDITIEKRAEINLGDVTCIVQQVGGDHAADSVIVYIKEEKILFLGDCIYPRMYAEKVHYTISETLRLLDVLETFDAETFIPSHQEPISKEAFDKEVVMLRTIAKYTEVCKGDLPTIVKEYENYVKRELTEDELETISHFADGY